MNKKELAVILEEHGKWWKGDGGQRADLQGAYLQGADLQGADLQSAYLQGAYLQGAYLQSAYLQETIYGDINWLAYIGIVPDKTGKARAYKLVTKEGEGIYQGGINYLEALEFSVPEVDADINIKCSYGVNLATLQWCIVNRQANSNRLLLMEFDVKYAVCPIGSDGKFRVKKCTNVGECDWDGNLI